jgi:hypothetical protein
MKKGTKGTKIAIAIGGLTLIGVGGYFIYKKFFGKKPMEILPTIETIPISSSTTTTTTSTNNTSTNNTKNVGCDSNYSGIEFPLKKGSCGYRVKTLQKYLGVFEDGQFGGDTESALKKRQNLVVANPIGYSAGYGKLSENDYKQLRSFNTPNIFSSSKPKPKTSFGVFGL